jgi:PAS domain S-box-containing protein/putative nucleotidyltransferase with HDIG domain
MMSKHLDVLIIEDSEYDTELLLRELKRNGYELEYERVETAEAMISALYGKKWDVILSDYSMPKFNGSAALKILDESGADIPFIFVSGTMGEDAAVGAMVEGASDYVVKSNLNRLMPAIERELREAKVRRAHRIIEKQYEVILQMARDGFWIIDVDGHFLEVNDAFCQMIGYSRDELLTMCVRDIEALESAAEAKSHIKRIIKKGSDRFETSHRCKDGSIVDVEISVNYIKEYGELIFVFVRDVTERKAEQERLRQSIEKLQVAFDFASEAIVVTNLKGEIKEVNNRALYLHNYDNVEDLIGLQSLKLIAVKDQFRAKENFRQTIKTGRSEYVEFTLMRKDGSEFLGEMSSSLLRDKSGNPTGFYAIIRDISERKRAEEALNKERSRAKMYLDNAAVLMLVVDDEGKVTLINRKGCEILGYSNDEIIGKNWFDKFSPERIRDSLKNEWYSEMLAGNIEPVLYFESPVVIRSGEEKVIAWHNVPITNDKNKIIGILSSGEDITVKRETEQALKESEENYRDIFESVAVSIWEEDLSGLKEWVDGLKNEGVTDFGQYFTQNPDTIYKVVEMIKVTNVNHQSLELFEAKNKKELMQALAKILTPSAFNMLTDEIIAIAEGKPSFKTEITLQTLRGNHLDVILTLVFPEAGSSFKCVPLTMVNITDRKLAEIELENSFKKLQRTLDKTVKALASAVEARDAYTAGHQQRVTLLAIAIAQELDLPQDRIDIIRIAGILHDIGKISVPAEILSKPGKLNDAEFNLMKLHPRSGYDIVKTVELPCEVAQIILQHHERLNGSGYPQGISGEDILFESRILAVADVVEAMSSHRPYRPALGIETALEEIKKNKGILYDEQVVDTCIKLFRDKNFKFE